MRRIPLIFLLLIGSTSFSASGKAAEFSRLGYKAEILDEKDDIDPPKLPDLTAYTVENLKAHIPAPREGEIDIVKMSEILGLKEFLKDGGIDKFTTLQGNTPSAIRIKKGVYTLEMLEKAVNDKKVLSCNHQVCLLSLPVYVGAEATLSLKEKDDLRLNSNTGAMITVEGVVTSVGATIEGWDAEKDHPSAYEHDKVFRPFLSFWKGSKAYMTGSTLRDMGYDDFKSYGLSFSSNGDLNKRKSQDVWLIENHIEGLYYGFYTYEASGIVVLNNKFIRNIYYGIDPHDRSDKLIITGNDVSESLKRHGIILSREVNNSWVFNNKSYKNTGSGIMVDRSSAGNVVAYNDVHDNAREGIYIAESIETKLYGNKIYKNGKNGIRVRNSWAILSYQDDVEDNAEYGIYAYSVALEHLERDFERDPYMKKLELSVRRSKFHRNKKGVFKVGNADHIRLSGINADKDSIDTFFYGDLGFFRGAASDAALDENKTVELTNYRNIPGSVKKVPDAAKR